GDEIKMREIAPGHFVYCSEEEEVMYKEKHAKLTAEAAAK
ncbi:TPA: peptide ABC transporter ATP-binding protein, partial [Listeria monocytogenes]